MKKPGFTLTELLIALTILGVIAVFTIPKVLQAQQDATYNAIAKEAAGMISGAYDAYRKEHTPTAATVPKDLTPYMNYARLDTTSTVDERWGLASYTCSGAVPCLRLHNGAVMAFHAESFGAANNSTLLFFIVDPDGKLSNGGTTDGPGKAVKFALYYNGRLTTRAHVLPGSSYGGLPVGPIADADPPWFSWD